MRHLRYKSARGLREKQTDAEKHLWWHLRNRQVDGYKFRRQQPVGTYIVDFVCMERRLIVELDGGQHQLQEASDSTRTRFFEEEGFRVLRFWNNQALKETEAVLTTIRDALTRATPNYPSPSPLPQGERESQKP